MKRFIALFIFGLVCLPVFAHAEDVMFDRILYTHSQAGFPDILWDHPFWSAEWLSDNGLAVTGRCDRIDFSGGLYVFDQNGDHVATKNTCRDTDDSFPHPCITSCGSGYSLVQKDGYILRALDRERSPIIYRKQGNNVSFASRYYNIDNDGEPTVDEDFAGGYEGVAIVGNRILIRRGSGILAGSTEDVVAFDFPHFNRLWARHQTDILLGGVGDFAIFAQNSHVLDDANTEIVAYRVTDTGLTEVNRVAVAGGRAYPNLKAGLQVDAQNPSIFAVAIAPNIVANTKIVRFRASANGIEKIDERAIPATSFAISGEYVVATGNTRNQALRVWNGTTPLTVEVPDELYSDVYGVPFFDSISRDVDIRPDGKIALAAHKWVILYSIGNVVTPPVVPPGPTATTTGPSIYDMFDGPSEPIETIFGSWLRVLRGVSDYE